MAGKIVFFDIDGTLYIYGRKIRSSTIEAIRLLKKNGHIPVICTGRTKSMVFSDIIDMGFDSMISGGGTYAEYGGKSLYLKNMEQKEIAKVAGMMKECGIFPIAEGHEYMYVDTDNIPESYSEIFRIYKKEIGARIRNIESENVSASKISGKIDKDSGIEKMENIFADDYTIVNHAGELLEMIPKPYTKAYGIDKMIKYLGIPRKDTYAFGDSFNDLEMLEYVKYGVAMGNSAPGLFEHVKYKTDDIENDGIYKGLERFGLI